MTDMGRPGCPAACAQLPVRLKITTRHGGCLGTGRQQLLPRSADSLVCRQLAKGRSREVVKTSMLAVVSIVMMRDRICCISFINCSSCLCDLQKNHGTCGAANSELYLDKKSRIVGRGKLNQILGVHKK